MYKVKLDLAPQTVIVHEGGIRQGQGIAEQHDMGASLGTLVGLGHDDDMQGLCTFLVEPLHLVQAGLDAPFHGRLFERVHREMVIIHLVAILAPGTSPSIGPSIGDAVPHRTTAWQ
jgi:hypothetical protein